MNILSRIRIAIHAATDDYPDVPNTADTEEEEEEQEPEEHVCHCQHNPKEDAEPAASPEVCGWLEIQCDCKLPKSDGENWPAGCSAVCPARIQNTIRAEQRRIENSRLYN